MTQCAQALRVYPPASQQAHYPTPWIGQPLRRRQSLLAVVPMSSWGVVLSASQPTVSLEYPVLWLALFPCQAVSITLLLVSITLLWSWGRRNLGEMEVDNSAYCPFWSALYVWPVLNYY